MPAIRCTMPSLAVHLALHLLAIQFGFEEASYTVSEGAGSVQYHLVFWGWLEREIIITVSAVEGSAERELW